MKCYFLLCSIIITSCTLQKSILSDYNSEGFIITSLKGSSIRLYVHPIIYAGEFGKSFENEYSSNGHFCSILTNELKEKLSRLSTIYIDNNIDMDSLFLNQSFSDGKSTRSKELFEQINEKYLLGIKRVVISKDVNQDPQVITTNMQVSAKNSRAAAGSRTNKIKSADDCVIRIVAEVWSVKEKKIVAKFTSIGQSKIYLLMYGRALNEALENSVSNIAEYIEE